MKGIEIWDGYHVNAANPLDFLSSAWCVIRNFPHFSILRPFEFYLFQGVAAFGNNAATICKSSQVNMWQRKQMFYDRGLFWWGYHHRDLFVSPFALRIFREVHVWGHAFWDSVLRDGIDLMGEFYWRIVNNHQIFSTFVCVVIQDFIVLHVLLQILNQLFSR